MLHCFTCNGSFDGKQIIVACIVCTELSHATNKCADLTASDIKVIELKKKPKLQFKCANCEKSGKLLFDISGMKNDLKNIKESCATIDSLCEKVDTAQEDLVNLKASVNYIPQIQRRIDRIKAALADPNSSQLVTGTLNSASIEGIVQEARERLLRSRNLLFFNIPHTNNQSTDLGIIIDMLKHIPIDTRYITTQRIGHPSSGNLRLIVVTISNMQYPHLVMKNRNKIPGRVSIGNDESRSQQAVYEEVAAELKADLGRGEKDLVIRYVKGIPTIVTAVAPPQGNNTQSSSS
ncbi:hypothetical protein QAD02_003454 [Eretmocerus hayati]|uniref:Uncharacterized protein n=1 Tax=Eretmocerus hayati TaxID=131215 RepID=A0ACC2NRN2_9HYME|nr:hypothetical protein QAD02_003454 [Eretmocerus hayati]